MWILKLPLVEGLPKGWPPLGPTQQLTNKLNDGKVLTEAEFEQLRRDAHDHERNKRAQITSGLNRMKLQQSRDSAR